MRDDVDPGTDGNLDQPLMEGGFSFEGNLDQIFKEGGLSCDGMPDEPLGEWGPPFIE